MRWATSPDHGARNIHNGSKPEGFVVISIPLSQVPWVGPDRHPSRTVNDCVSRHAVWIETGLWLASPKNGNISNVDRRLSVISLPSCSNWEYRDGQPIHKKPQLAGTYRIRGPTIS